MCFFGALLTDGRSAQYNDDGLTMDVVFDVWTL